MSSEFRHDQEYMQTDPHDRCIALARDTEAHERRRLAKRHSLVVARLERDRQARRIIGGIVVVVLLAFGAWLVGIVPVPVEWTR